MDGGSSGCGSGCGSGLLGVTYNKIPQVHMLLYLGSAATMWMCVSTYVCVHVCMWDSLVSFESYYLIRVHH